MSTFKSTENALLKVLTCMWAAGNWFGNVLMTMKRRHGRQQAMAVETGKFRSILRRVVLYLNGFDMGQLQREPVFPF